MTFYRAHIVGEDGHFLNVVHLECPDDDAAKVEAKNLVDGHDIELWDRARKVATFPHKDSD